MGRCSMHCFPSPFFPIHLTSLPLLLLKEPHLHFFFSGKEKTHHLPSVTLFFLLHFLDAPLHPVI